jgi:hypothetical protein
VTQRVHGKQRRHAKRIPEIIHEFSACELWTGTWFNGNAANFFTLVKIQSQEWE